MMDGDPRSDADADAAWQSSSTIMLPSTIVPAVALLPGPDPVQGPRNLHPYLRSNDATAYYYAVPIRSTLPEAPQPDDWILDPDADVGVPFLRCYGRKAVTRLVANPGHRALKRSDLTSLVKFTDETYMVLRNVDIQEATRQLGAPPPPPQPIPPPLWRQAQIDALAATPATSVPWIAPTWGASCTDPDREPVPYLEHRRGRRTVFIRAIDPDNLLRHERERPPHEPRPPEPDPDDSNDDSPMEHYVSPKKQSRRSGRRRGANAAHYASSISSFRGGTAVNAFCSVRDPSCDDPFATRSILIGLDSHGYTP
jgi:hypothetical protein